MIKFKNKFGFMLNFNIFYKKWSFNDENFQSMLEKSVIDLKNWHPENEILSSSFEQIEEIFANEVKNITEFTNRLSDDDKEKIYIAHKMIIFFHNLDEFLPKGNIKIIKGNIKASYIMTILKNTEYPTLNFNFLILLQRFLGIDLCKKNLDLFPK